MLVISKSSIQYNLYHAQISPDFKIHEKEYRIQNVNWICFVQEENIIISRLSDYPDSICH